MKNLAFRRMLAVAVLFVSAAAASAQNPAGGPGGAISSAPSSDSRKALGRLLQKTDHDLKVAGELVDRYAQRVRAYKSGKFFADDGVADCQKNFKLDAAFSASTTDPAATDAAIRFQSCVALTEETPLACQRLASIGDPHAASNCVWDARQLKFYALAASASPEAARACAEFLISSRDVNASIPPSRQGTLCAAFLAGKKTETVLAAARKLSGSPLPAALVAGIRQMADVLWTPGFRCGPESSSTCRDAVSIVHAGRAGGASACGENSSCRAVFGGGGSSCLPLSSELSRVCCVAQNKDSSMRRAYDSANSSVAGALQQAEGLEPHSDPRSASRLSRARVLRSRLDKILKLTVSGPKK